MVPRLSRNGQKPIALCRSSVSCQFVSFNLSQEVGITSRVKNVEVTTPPITAIFNALRKSALHFYFNATGIIPAIRAASFLPAAQPLR